MERYELKIYHENQFIGTLCYFAQDDEFSLFYEEDWKGNGFPISPHLSFNKNIKSPSIKKYFENQFPEGLGLEILLEEFRIGKTNIFRIIQIIGSDAVGAFSYKSKNEQITSFREITQAELLHKLSLKNSRELIIWDGKPRLSLAGVQDKLAVTILPNHKMGFGEGELASTHIIKFQKEDARIPNLILNEYFCMKLAKLCKLKVSEVEMRRIEDFSFLMVKRFDRIFVNKKYVKRLHVIDACQALDLPLSYKYERNFGDSRDVKDIRDGVSFQKLFSLARSCENPALAILETLNWAIFNLCVSNSDAHGKNYSYFLDQNGLMPTPYYDIVNLAVYEDLEQSLAMAVGDEFYREEIRAYQFKVFCDECEINKKLFIKQFKKISNNILKTIELVNVQTTDPREILFVEKLKKNIVSQTNMFLACVDEILKIND